MTTEARLDRHEWTVQTVPLRTCQQMVRAWHYAGAGSNTATYRHGLLRADELARCYGVAWWIPPTRSAAEASWEGDWKEVLSLSRLVLDPAVPANGATFLLAASVRLIRAEGRYRCLVTYADTWRGHTGTIYRAANWEYLGLTAKEATFVEETTGRMVARKAGPRTRTRDEMAALGYRNVGSYAKHKYRLILPSSRPRRDLFSGMAAGRGDGR